MHDGTYSMRQRLQEGALSAQRTPTNPPTTTTLVPITAEEIESARTPAGGWTKDTLARWGVPWPPPKGWKKRLLSGDQP